MQQSTRTNTKAALIGAAERLFAEKGLGTVTVKDITLAAGARNPSAVHYHFGNIETLIREVFTQRYQAIEAARMQRLMEISAAEAEPSLEALMEAALAPLFEACLEEDGRLYVRFCIQLISDPRFDVVALVEDVDVSTAKVIRDHVIYILAELPKDVLRTRLRHTFSISLIQAVDFARRVEIGKAPAVDDAIQDAALCLTGFLRACAS